MPEKYTFEKAEEETAKMRELVDGDKAGNYAEAEKIADQNNAFARLNPEQREQLPKLVACLSRGYIDTAVKIKDRFNLPEAEVRAAAKEGLVACLSRGYIDTAIEIKDRFNLPEEIISTPEVRAAAKEGLVACLSRGYIDTAIEIKDRFNLPEAEVRAAAKEGLVAYLSRGYIDTAIEINDGFNPKITPTEIISHFPGLQALLDKVEPTAPAFVSQIKKSVDLTISLFKIKNRWHHLPEILEREPFLADALAANPQFGSKLFVKFPQLDETSKQNIKLQFNAKKEILAANPEIDHQSLGFRRAMQEKLQSHGRNREIMETAGKKGINTNKWLGYDETDYFKLAGDRGTVNFSETLAAPVARIRETIDTYAHIVKETLKGYKPELLAHEIVLEDTAALEAQMKKMTAAFEAAKAAGDEKKADGIERGLANLKAKMANPKKGKLWDKLLGDISTFQGMKESIFAAQEKLAAAEEGMDKALLGKTPSGKEIQDLKQKIAAARDDLKNKFVVLERRIDGFRQELPPLISPALGADRVGALSQEIETRMAEEFSHYDTDRSTVTNLFADKQATERDKMEGLPMSVFVWARNPDIDLYQGNYSPCCICIESQHMGAESTIADYNTDLGVQVVNIWDETKNEPVTAAWCWLGINAKGETALVVDNIEANTRFSANFSEQLTAELMSYLKKYARAIGAKKLVMGKANNDLPTAGELSKLPNDEHTYEKIGGANRADGYFLEAEEKNVKLLWEEEKMRKAGKEKKEISPAKFEEIAVSPLAKTDLDKIIALERKIYRDTDLARGQALAADIKSGNGLEYSFAARGRKKGKKTAETIGYLAAIEDETDEGDPSVYLEDIAVLPEAERQGVGWNMLKGLVAKLKTKAVKEGKPVLFDMHLRETSRNFMEKHKEELENMGVKQIEEAVVPDYYDENEDALYRVYEIAL